MQFRERRRVIQVIRTIYDPELKRGRSEVVGKIDKDSPTIPDKLAHACSAEEIGEITAWLTARGESLKSASARGSVATLPEEMRQAAAHFHGHHSGEPEAAAQAEAIWRAWDELKKAMRKAGYAKPHGKHHTGSRNSPPPQSRRASP
ncbi:MAG TPA: hypothetical protein VEB64_04435 [Azospirillaceae bacterium]|nr:hypothetical protein [Azospirillaceae bacterium]